MKISDFLALIVSTFIASSCLIVFPVFADPAPQPPHTNWFNFSTYALFAEVVAWLVGAEVLWLLSRKRKWEISRSESYKVMGLAMIISFVIGVMFWVIYGWL